MVPQAWLMRLTDDAEEVAARIADWTVDVIRDLQEARARGLGAVMLVGDEMFEVVEDGTLRLTIESKRGRPRQASNLAKALK